MTSPSSQDLSPQTPSFSPSDSNSTSSFLSPDTTDSETLHQDDQPDFLESPIDYHGHLQDENSEYVLDHYKQALFSRDTILAQKSHHPRMLSDVLPLPQAFSDSSKSSTPSIYIPTPAYERKDLARSLEDEVDPFSASFGEANAIIPYHTKHDSSTIHSPHSFPESGPHLPDESVKSVSKRPFLRLCSSVSYSFSRNARDFSPCFPEGHQLLKSFVHEYLLLDQLGSGGYGFVMTARHRSGNCDVAVKFIIKDKVPENSWIQTEDFIKPLPIEFIILHYVRHENIIRCLDLFEDDVYFYMVMELHGDPWRRHSTKKSKIPRSPASKRGIPRQTDAKENLDTPGLKCLNTSFSTLSVEDGHGDSSSAGLMHASQNNLSLPHSSSYPASTSTVLTVTDTSICHSASDAQALPDPLNLAPNPSNGRNVLPRRVSDLQTQARPQYSRRASHDLFECIEQSKNKCLTPLQARYVFAQVVHAVHHLDQLGIRHRDIKDENVVIDKDFRIKLIDFGSATIDNPDAPLPYYDIFYGTTAYAASEILRKKPYQAPPAEIWTLGILLSYLLTGSSPFAHEYDAILGNIKPELVFPSKESELLLRRCLDPYPGRRATIAEVKAHPWLKGAIDGL